MLAVQWSWKPRDRQTTKTSEYQSDYWLSSGACSPVMRQTVATSKTVRHLQNNRYAHNTAIHMMRLNFKKYMT